METVRFKIELQMVDDKKVESITQIIIGENQRYLFPKSLQNGKLHTELFKLSPIKAAVKALKRIGQYRCPRVGVAEITDIYFDEWKNPIFMGKILEEESESDEEDKDRFDDLLDAIRMSRQDRPR